MARLLEKKNSETLSSNPSSALQKRLLAFIHDAEGQKKHSFEELSLAVFDYQFRQNNHYRAFCLAVGQTPRQISRWQDIPAIPTLGFKELVLTTFPTDRAVRVFKTSGTTVSNGFSPSAGSGRGAHFFETLDFYNAAILPPFKRYLFPDQTRGFSYFFLMPSPQEARDSSLSYMMGVVNKALGAGRGKFYVQKGDLKLNELESDLKRAKKKVILLSTAFALKAFLDKLKTENKKIKLPRASRLMETGGFKGRVREVSKKNLYSECRERLGIPPEYCVSEYGMTELSSQFYDTSLRDKILKNRRKPVKMGPPWTRTLAIDIKTGKPVAKGKPGILRHFDLANVGSVMAVQTEDLGRQAGKGFELLGRAPSADLRGCSLVYEEFLRG